VEGLAAVDARILGVVLNGIDPSATQIRLTTVTSTSPNTRRQCQREGKGLNDSYRNCHP
jgi:hypothetical protein